MASDIKEARTDAAGLSTRYLEQGQGKPVVLVHGGGAGADSWGNWRISIPLLAAQGFRVLAVDMVGFGDTAKPDPDGFEYSQDARTRHLVGFLEALDLSDAVLVGNSMGGLTSMGATLAVPDRVDKLVLMGSAGLATEITPALMPILNYDFTPDGMRKLISSLTNQGFEASEEMVQYRWKRSIDDETRKAYSATMGWVKQQGGLKFPEEVIASVKHKTLVIGGKQDLIVPLDKAYRFLELIERSWGYIIPNCGHWAMIEHPEEFAGALTHFIKNT